jgi:hypothetical protein
MQITKTKGVTYPSWDEIDKDLFATEFGFELSDGDVTTLCPFHKDHNPSLSFSFYKGVFHCWSCAESGNFIRFVSGARELSYDDAASYIGKTCSFRRDGKLLPTEALVAMLNKKSSKDKDDATSLFWFCLKLSEPISKWLTSIYSSGDQNLRTDKFYSVECFYNEYWRLYDEKKLSMIEAKAIVADVTNYIKNVCGYSTF